MGRPPGTHPRPDRAGGGVRFLLATLQSNLTWKFGTTRLVTQILNAVTKKDYGPFMEENYWGLGLPPAK